MKVLISNLLRNNKVVYRNYVRMRYGFDCLRRKLFFHKERVINGQLAFLRENYNKDTKKIILFMMPAIDGVGGGIMAKCHLYKETISLRDVHGCEVLAVRSLWHNFNWDFCQYTGFNNQVYVFYFESIMRYFNNLESITLHIGEDVQKFVEYYNICMSKSEYKWWTDIAMRHINVLNMHIKLMSEPDYVKSLENIANKVTQTTAHLKYANLEMRKKYGIPLHHLSARFEDVYEVYSFTEKKKVVMVSDDLGYENGADISTIDKIKRKILDNIKKYTDFEIVVVKDMKYEEYKKLAKEAMFSITFGEGLDGYFIEPVWSGGVSFAVYNEEFFTKDFEGLTTVYNSYNHMLENICRDIKYFQNEKTYYDYNMRIRSILDKQYSIRSYRENIRDFYLGKYLYP